MHDCMHRWTLNNWMMSGMKTAKVDVEWHKSCNINCRVKFAPDKNQALTDTSDCIISVIPHVSDFKSRFGGFFGFLYSLAFAR
jgi:hypothetical protein